MTIITNLHKARAVCINLHRGEEKALGTFTLSLLAAPCTRCLLENKGRKAGRKEGNTTSFVVHLKRSQVLYRAAQGHRFLLTKPGTIGAINVQDMGCV